MRGGGVMKKVDSWPSFAWSCLIVKLFHFLQYRILVESASDCMTRWTRHLNDWPTWIKENCVQHLFRTYRALGSTGTFLIFSSPSALLCGSNMCTQVSSPVRNNPTITAFACFQKFPGTFKAFCLLLLSEQMRYPPSAILSQVQTLFSELFAHCLLICQYNYLYLWQTIAHPVRPQSLQQRC